MGNAHGSVFDNPVHDADVFRETASGRLEAASAANFLIHGTLGESLVTAVIALAAWDVMKDHNSVPSPKIDHALANRRDDAGSFVAENARSGVRTRRDLLEVSATNTARVHAQQQFPSAKRGHGNGFQANVIDTAINRRQHSGGNFLDLIFDRELPSYRHDSLDELRIGSASIA